MTTEDTGDTGEEQSAQDRNWEKLRNSKDSLKEENEQLREVASRGLAASVGLDPDLPVTKAATEQFLDSVEDVQELDVSNFQSFVTDDFGLNPEAVGTTEQTTDEEEEEEGKANEEQMDDFQRGAEKLRGESQQPDSADGEEEEEPDVLGPDGVDASFNSKITDLVSPSA